MTARRINFEISLAALSLIALLFRVGYVVAQPATDPAATRAMLDGAYYLEWGQALAAGTPFQTGAYYLAPFYAWFLGGFFTLFGDNIAWLYLLQHVALVSTAALLGLVARNLAGESAGLGAAALLLLYHPALFFASRPLGEPLALLFLALAVLLFVRGTPLHYLIGGFATALGALARPNFLLVVLVWFLIGFVAILRQPRSVEESNDAKRRGAALALAVAAFVLVLTPVLVRNWRASGHLVPISANSGLTLYHGNGPGAKGIGVLPPGFSGLVSSQMQEATYLASIQVGHALDDVDADRWWGRQAVRARLADPVDTLLLQLRRTGLFLSTRELDLDYAPSIDANPWRWTAPLPFALLLGLASGALFGAGFRRSGGWVVWGGVAACAATPLLFYASSRYRFPTAALLVIPAGVGIAELLRSRGRHRLIVVTVVVVVTLISVLVPAHEVARTAKAVALANRGTSWKQSGDLARAEQDLLRALETDSNCAVAHFGLGVLHTQLGDPGRAEGHYRDALRLRPTFVEAAQNLSRLLNGQGRADESISLLLQALAIRPDHAGCWKNLIVAHYLMGDPVAARSAAGRARRSGAILEPEWLEGVARAYAGAIVEDPARQGTGKDTSNE